MHILKEFFSFSLVSAKNQKVINTGPYSIVRHPGYLAGALLMISCGLGIHPTIYCFVILVVVYYFVWSNRIRLEEGLLIQGTGNAYLEYKKKVPYALVPYIW
jgi:protein-S-isoprenylcysteine O-methyltransferase Ste14